MPQTRRNFSACLLALACLTLVRFAGSTTAVAAEPPALALQAGDVVAFIGGADVAAAQFTGHLEALLAVRFRGLQIRCRNFGWEGDTVFQQIRDVGFPPLPVHLQRAGATVLLLQYGRTEALAGRTNLAAFLTAYERLLDAVARPETRLILVTPPPFENGGGHLPDLTVHNADLAAYSEAIVGLAGRRHLPVINLFAELGGLKSSDHPLLTSDGLQLTPRGHGIVASAFSRAAESGGLGLLAGGIDDRGIWSNPAFERVRQAVLAKNRLWFDYWRPQNWAFLGGDRTEQPSSRDYRDPKIRWFPAEMERFVPLLQHADQQIQEAAAAVKE